MSAKSFLKKFGALAVLLFLLMPFFAQAVNTDELRKQIEQKQAEIQALEKQIAAYNEQIKNQKSLQNTLSKQIASMETQIKKLQTDIKLIQTKISAVSLQIDELSNDINLKNSQLEKQKNNLSETIRTINEYDQESSIFLVMKNNKFSDFLNQVQFIDSLQESIKEKLGQVKEIKKQLESQKSDFETQKDNLENLKDELSDKNIVLNNQKDDKEDLLVKTKSQEKKYQQMLADLQKKRQEIQKEIYSLEDKLRLIIDPASIPTARSGFLTRPHSGELTQTYGPTSETGFLTAAYKFHNGIDIGVHIGDPIKAAYEGTVKAIGDNGRYAYGKWITIDHHNGLITLYGHLSGYKVKVGQTVSAGQTIGYGGNTGYSTGPHLHFTVYAADTFSTQEKWYGLLPVGGSINPMNYL